jgi:hypothetical protein
MVTAALSLVVVTALIFDRFEVVAQVPKPSVETGSDNSASVTSIAVNADSRTYDSHPSATTTDDGSTWITWHAYHGGRDQIILRRNRKDGTLGPRRVVSENGKVHGPSVLVKPSADSVWVVWSPQLESR